MRVEKDSFGSKKIPDQALYGIQSLRAAENFPGDKDFPKQWYEAMGDVKLSCYETIEEFYNQIDCNKEKLQSDVQRIPSSHLKALKQAAKEISQGDHFNHFKIPAISGGAGTSINMNINEIIANRALQQLGKPLGDYNTIDPYEDANRYQSTNDTVPTALRVALMKLLDNLQQSINLMRQNTEELEKKHFNHLRSAFTQLQEAVPTSIGRLFSSYNEAFSRDWWRISKAKERIKTINLGASAAGTGMSVPRYFIMFAPAKLREISRQPVTRSDNLAESTSNLDCFVEMHSMIKTLAVNLEKMARDIRLAASDMAGQNRFIQLKARQAGSSIMPGKVNPVISEYIISNSAKVYANDQLITALSARGDFELNAYLPIIGATLIDSLKRLCYSCDSAYTKLLSNMEIRVDAALKALYQSPSITTALIPHCGYHQAQRLALLMKKEGCSIQEANYQLKVIPSKLLNQTIQPENLLTLGFSLKKQEKKHGQS